MLCHPTGIISEAVPSALLMQWEWVMGDIVTYVDYNVIYNSKFVLLSFDIMNDKQCCS